MTLYDLMICIGALIILITAVFRLNDIKRSQSSKRWWVRRLGLLLVSVAMGGEIAAFFTVASPYWAAIVKFLEIWGIALTWITTPHMVPWYRFISRYDPKDSP